MTLIGRQVAIVIKELADFLDVDAHDVLSRGLEPLAQETLSSVGREDLAHSESALRAVCNWMSRVPSVAGWQRRAAVPPMEHRVPRELGQLDLDSSSISRITHFMAANTTRGTLAERLITVRQRRRNINSQTRQMLKPLDLEWLGNHIDPGVPEWRREEIWATAVRLSGQPIEAPIDIDRWRDEVPDFRADFVSADAAESPRLRSATTSDPTSRTYRASWVKFWLDNDVERLLLRLIDEDGFEADVRRMLGHQDGSEGLVRVRIRRPDPSELLKFPVTSMSYRSSPWSSDSSPVEQRFSGLSGSRLSARDEGLPRRETAVDSIGTASRLELVPFSALKIKRPPAPSPTERIRFSVRPQGQPGNDFTRTWPSAELAAATVARFIEKILNMSDEGKLWDFIITLQTDSGLVSIDRSGRTAEQMASEAARLISHIESLA